MAYSGSEGSNDDEEEFMNRDRIDGTYGNNKGRNAEKEAERSEEQEAKGGDAGTASGLNGEPREDVQVGPDDEEDVNAAEATEARDVDIITTPNRASPPSPDIPPDPSSPPTIRTHHTIYPGPATDHFDPSLDPELTSAHLAPAHPPGSSPVSPSSPSITAINQLGHHVDAAGTTMMAVDVDQVEREHEAV